ncbi:hypothetical protein SCG7109_AB_00080 [Chlamydiales bacterium SCGC AG-110-M15]|nr:hypothetical protein SCG7109_AB_00080 [Chlamydiales bacterium SCGC AG-110-M15]
MGYIVKWVHPTFIPHSPFLNQFKLQNLKHFEELQ